MKRIWILLLLLTACAQPAKVQTAQPVFRAMGESVAVEKSRSDESIGFDVRRQLDLVGVGASVGIVIEVDGGIVTLRGVAPSVAASWRAQGAAQAVPGVKQVVNHIVTPNANTNF